MAGPIENFKLDMADDHDISFAEAGEVVSIIISMFIEEAPGRPARQKVVNAFAKMIATEYAETEKLFLATLAKKDEMKAELKRLAQARKARGDARNQKRFDKLVAKYF